MVATIAVGRVDVPTFDHGCDALPKGGIRMIFWDMGGEDELQCLWEKYYGDTHGIVYVIDATDRDRLRTSQESFGT
jgi:GTPase SAR1 family protein